MKKHLLRQRGDHHALLIVGAVIALVGVLGFVGYNSWQKQSANAEVCAQLKTPQARLTCLQGKLDTANKEIAQLKAAIKSHPNQKKENAARQNRINQLTGEIVNYQYVSRIAALKKQISADAAKPTRPSGEVADKWTAIQSDYATSKDTPSISICVVSKTPSTTSYKFRAKRPSAAATSFSVMTAPKSDMAKSQGFSYNQWAANVATTSAEYTNGWYLVVSWATNGAGYSYTKATQVPLKNITNC